MKIAAHFLPYRGFARIRGRVAAVLSEQTGALHPLHAAALAGPVTWSKVSGNANLSVSGGAIVAAAVLSPEDVQSIVVRGESGDEAIEFQISLTGRYAFGLARLAATKAIQIGTSIQSDVRQARPGPTSGSTLQDFARDNYPLWVTGIHFMPDIFQPTQGVFATSGPAALLARAARANAVVHGHCLVYPKRWTGTWWATGLTSGNWQSRVHAHMAAIAAVPGAQDIVAWDVLNEVIDGDGDRTDNPLFTLLGNQSYIKPCFDMAAAHFPNADLYWCQDQSEQIISTWEYKLAANVLKAIETAKNAGAPIDGYNFQAHLIHAKAVNKATLRAFLLDLASLGLKIKIGELDVRTGYHATYFPSEPLPSSYADGPTYDAAMSVRITDALAELLPFVQDTSGVVVAWNAADASHWMEPPFTPSGERPSLFDKDYLPKAQYEAVSDAIAALPSTPAPPTSQELVTNGTFTTNTNGWTITLGTGAVVSGKLRLTTGAGGSCRAEQQVFCGKPGKSMTLHYDRDSISTNARIAIYTGTGQTGTQLAAITNFADETNGSLAFTVPDQGYVFLQLYAAGSAAQTCDFDNISIVAS